MLGPTMVLACQLHEGGASSCVCVSVCVCVRVRAVGTVVKTLEA